MITLLKIYGVISGILFIISCSMIIPNWHKPTHKFPRSWDVYFGIILTFLWFIVLPLIGYSAFISWRKYRKD